MRCVSPTGPGGLGDGGLCVERGQLSMWYFIVTILCAAGNSCSRLGTSIQMPGPPQALFQRLVDKLYDWLGKSEGYGVSIAGALIRYSKV